MKDSRLQTPLHRNSFSAPIWDPPAGYKGPAPDCYCEMHGFYNVPRGPDGFPSPFQAQCPGCKNEEHFHRVRAPLVDRFAMAALTGLVIGDGPADPETVAAAAYRYANAMMAERARQAKGE